jgi:hypothetical protein
VAAFSLRWSSPSQPLEVIPTHYLFSGYEELVGSPFEVLPTARKPTAVQSVALSIESWRSLAVTFKAPEDNGGISIASYTVEWYDANAGFGPLDVQSVLLASEVYDGHFTFAGSSYLAPFDASNEEIEYILESIPGLGDVEVHRHEFPGSNGWSITFLTNSGAVSALSIDDDSLIRHSSGPMASSVVCSGGSAYGSGGLSCLAENSRVGSAALRGSSALDSFAAVDMDIGSDDHFTYVITHLDQDSAVPEGFAVRVTATNAEGFTSIPSEIEVMKPMAVADAPRRRSGCARQARTAL